MSRNTVVASTAAVELEDLPAEAQAFHRRARIVDAAVREIAEHGYGQVTVAGIAERAGVSRRVFYGTFEDKQDALIWAYDAAAAYAIPQIRDALSAERDWVRAAAAALSTYLTILDCDREWALACLRDVPAAGERARAARDAVRAPVLHALQQQISARAPAGVGVDTVLTAIDAVTIDCLRHDPQQSLLDRQEELTALALAPFTDELAAALAPGAAELQESPFGGGELAALLAGGEAAEADLERLVRESAAQRDGPALWRVVIALQQRRAAGRPVAERVWQSALDALDEAWFFGLVLGPSQPPVDAAVSHEELRHLRFLVAHPASTGEQVRRGLGVRHLSQVNRTLRRLEARGLVRRAPGEGRAGEWTVTAAGGSGGRAQFDL
jgi:AcrR family transcriptional regulator